VQFSVVGHVLVERNRERAPVQSPGEPELWKDDEETDDAALVRALATPPDAGKVFESTIRALVDGLLKTPDSPAQLEV